MKIVQIKCNGEMFDLNEHINLRNIKKVLTSISNSTTIQYLYSWDYEGYTIMCYGYTDGSVGNENKHAPPDGMKHIKTLDNSDTQLLFGDIFILMKKKSLCDFDTSDYGLFYSICFDGIYDNVSDDNVSDDDVSDDNDNNVSDDDVSDDDVSSDDCMVDNTNSYTNDEYIGDSDELDEDTSEY